MYNAHPYFSLKNLGKKVRIIHGKIRCIFMAALQMQELMHRGKAACSRLQNVSEMGVEPQPRPLCPACPLDAQRLSCEHWSMSATWLVRAPEASNKPSRAVTLALTSLSLVSSSSRRFLSVWSWWLIFSSCSSSFRFWASNFPACVSR